jgi:hypothetical protein
MGHIYFSLGLHSGTLLANEVVTAKIAIKITNFNIILGNECFCINFVNSKKKFLSVSNKKIC